MWISKGGERGLASRTRRFSSCDKLRGRVIPRTSGPSFLISQSSRSHANLETAELWVVSGLTERAKADHHADLPAQSLMVKQLLPDRRSRDAELQKRGGACMEKISS